jgi:hypothetical protein
MLNLLPVAIHYGRVVVNAYHGYIYVPVYCYWRIYDITNQKIANYFLHRDTLVWEADDWREVKPGDQLPGYLLPWPIVAPMLQKSLQLKSHLFGKIAPEFFTTVGQSKWWRQKNLPLKVIGVEQLKYGSK